MFVEKPHLKGLNYARALFTKELNFLNYKRNIVSKIVCKLNQNCNCYPANRYIHTLKYTEKRVLWTRIAGDFAVRGQGAAMTATPIATRPHSAQLSSLAHVMCITTVQCQWLSRYPVHAVCWYHPYWPADIWQPLSAGHEGWLSCGLYSYWSSHRSCDYSFSSSAFPTIFSKSIIYTF